MKKHKGLKITLLIIGALLIAALVWAWSTFGSQLVASQSITKLEDGLYCMEYVGDYGFDKYLQQGGAPSDAKMADYIAAFLSGGFWKPDNLELEPDEYGCSTLSVSSPDGAELFARNYDWADCDAMIVHAVPKNGYESISTCCLDFLGFGEGWKPEGTANKFMALAAVYVPLDGMNEMGVCIADLMAGDKVETHQDTDKPDLTTCPAIRLVLDHAATVDEAVELISQYDMNSSIGSAHHYAISDASGKSVVVEYVNGEMLVTETKVVTNFYIADCDKQGVGSEQSHKRFERLMELREKANGVMSADELRDALASVSQSNYPDGGEDTEWTLVYDTAALTARFYRDERFDKPYALTLGTKDGWITAAQ